MSREDRVLEAGQADRLNAALEGRYAIEREIGQGGMATVYLAHDLKHDRQVALKVLKPELAAVVGAERFLAEIKTTAHLQHPHILPLYDSGEADGFLFFVMPYVEGESLRDRLNRQKQLPVEEALRITTAVAEALDFAHRHGVIHRDIKPANILMQDGQPVVGDFGIALAVGAAGGTRLTETGLSVGTPFYMSPEQATGDREVGPTADTYSLGCVLYEMLSGDPPYVGSTAQAVLGQIIAGEAKPVRLLRPSVPANVEAALRRALEKLPADRFPRTAGFAAALRNPAFRYGDDEPARAAGPRLWSWLGPVFAALFLVAAGVAAWALLRPTATPVTRLKVAFDSEEALWYTGLDNQSRVGIAPDGSRFVYTGPAGAREQMLWVRRLDQLNGQQLTGTRGGVAPAVSPDGGSVAYLYPTEGLGYAIRLVSLAGGIPVTVVPPPVFSEPVWGDDGFIYFMATPSTLARVPGGGGAVDSVLTIPEGDGGAWYTHPFVIPGQALVVTSVRGVVSYQPSTQVQVVDWKTGRITASVNGARGLITATGDFAYVTADGILMAQKFDRGSLAPVGNAVPVERGLDVRYSAWVDLALSKTGTLLYTLTNTQAPERWVWVDGNGSTEPLDPDWTDTEFESVELSPDGSRMAVEIEREGRFDIWIKRLAGGAPSRLTFRGNRNKEPAWSPDGSRVAFISYSDEGQDAWVRQADGSGSPRLLLDLDADIHEVLWTPDQKRLIVVVLDPGYDIVTVDLDSADAAPVPLLTGPYDEHEPAISPDGRWLAYTSTETGRHEVFVVPFPNVGDGKWQISTDGGREPRWSHDGSRLYVRHGDGSGLDVVDMSSGPNAARRRTVFDVPPERYFELNPDNHMYDVTPDGRVLMLEAGSGDISGDLVVVQNWYADLERRLERGGQ